MSRTLTVNGRAVELPADPEQPLLWWLRDELGLKASRYGCGAGLCGACTVLVDGAPIRACVTPAAALAGRSITTLEGLQGERVFAALREAWIANAVPQCGYCQSGQLTAAFALLTRTTKPSDGEVDSAFAGHLCRCGTYPRIRKAVAEASDVLGADAAG